MADRQSNEALNNATSTKKPSSSAFRQQRLKAWQPILTPRTVLPAFFVLGICFIPIGVGLFISSNQVNEISMDYTLCQNQTSPPPNSNIVSWSYNSVTQTCTLVFNITTTFVAPVYLYYGLTNFYQNHRRYVKSYVANQLSGQALPISSLSDCDPIIEGWPNGTEDGSQLPVYPCGLIANSLFNDTFSNLTSLSGGGTYNFSESGIAWPSDASKYGKTAYTSTEVVPPPNWAKYQNNYTILGIPNLALDEHFQVWMRTAGLPNFRKLYAQSSTDLTAGVYSIDVVDIFPVQSFSGTKSVVLSTTSWLGGKNPFLGIAYMVVGSVCLILGIAFLIRHIVKPRKLGDQTLLSWNRVQ